MCLCGQNHVMDRASARHRQHHRHHQPSSSVDFVTSPTSATSTSLSDILVTKRSSWPRVIPHPSSADWPANPRRASSRHGRASTRSSRRARSSSPFSGGRSVDDGWTLSARAADLDTSATSPVDGATVVRCLDSCDKILLRHSTTIT